MKRLLLFAKCLGSMLLAIFVLNLCCIGWNIRPSIYHRNSNATGSVYQPGGVVINGKEGFGINKADANGYFNYDYPLAENGYVLCLGGSHDEALQIMQSQNYVRRLNSRLAKKDELVVYNMGAALHSYDRLVRGFEAAISEFPDSKAVLISIDASSILDFEAIKEATDNIRKYDAEETAPRIEWGNLHKQKMRKCMPSIFNIYISLSEMRAVDNTKFHSISSTNDSTEENINNTKDEKQNSSMFYDAFVETQAYLRSVYKGTIIIVYRPEAVVSSDGELEIRHAEYFDELKRACDETGVFFLNCEDEFRDLYVTEKKLPYGFPNTEINAGHLNKYGHQCVANALEPVLKEILFEENE